jgi:PBSX family phage terminase large subunit
LAVIDLSNLFPEAEDGTRSPLPKQRLTMDLCLDPDGPSNIAYYGGFGSGKSLILCIVNILWGVLHGGEYVIARQFMPELRRTTYQVFKEILPPELLIEERVADAQFRIKSQKGEAKFHFVGLDEPGKLDSLNLSGVSIDEASQTSEEAMLKLQGRLRNTKGLRKMLLVGNPKGHDFVYRYFIKQDCFQPFRNPVTKKLVTVEQQKRNYRMIVAPSTENKHLPPNYVASMLSTYSKERIERDIMGSFDAFQGQIYTEFSRNLHVIKPFRIPEEWTKFIGADHGYNNPAAFIWIACDYDGNLYAYREFYEREWHIDEIVKGNRRPGFEGKGIVELSKGEKLEGIWIDPSTKADRGKESDFSTYTDHLPGHISLLPANNSVSTGIDRVKQYLRVNERTGKPRLFIFETCSNLIDEIIKYKWAEQPPGSAATKNEKEDPVKKDDHACDALRYGLMSRPEEPKRADLTQKLRQASTLSGSVQRELHDLKRGGKGYKDMWGEKYGEDPGMSDDEG